MSFWLPATAIPLLTAAVLCWPLLRQDAAVKGAGLALVALITATTLLLYQGVGSPQGIDVQPVHPPQAQGGNQMEDMVVQLQARLEQQPDDLDGWLLLGRSYKSLQQYDNALAALQRAAQIEPDSPLVKVELAEAMIFTSGGPGISPEAVAMLESAVAQDPQIQKGLWLLGIVAFQAEDYAGALTYWERLMALLEPGSGIAQSVQQQISEANARLGIAPAATWPGVEAVVSAPADLGDMPATAALFVVARDPAAPVPPLGAVRVPLPDFPITVRLTDANAMMPQRPLSGMAQIEVFARLSMSGQPTAADGDPRSETVVVDTADGASIQLQLDQP